MVWYYAIRRCGHARGMSQQSDNLARYNLLIIKAGKYTLEIKY